MSFAKLYTTVLIAGIIGAIAGAFAGGFIAADRCDGGLECLGAAVLGVGLGAILVESGAMVLAVHYTNQRRGNPLLTFLPTILLAAHTVGVTAGIHRRLGDTVVPISSVGLRKGTACHQW